jgi:hypothetical protein
MLSFYTSPSEISLVLELSDARWLSEEMSFLAELYRSKAESSERQFGGDNNAALTSFLETETKCAQLSVVLQQALRRGFRQEDQGRPHDHSDQLAAAASIEQLPHPALASPNSKISSTSTETKRARPTAKQRRAKRDPSPRNSRPSKTKPPPPG